MCLEELKEIEIGGNILYKVFRVLNNHLYSPLNNGGRLKRRRWLKEENYRDPNSNNTLYCSRFCYPKGWHCFINKKDAQSYAKISPTLKVFKVKFKDLKKTGTQRSYWFGVIPFQFNCAVVGQMLILDEAK